MREISSGISDWKTRRDDLRHAMTRAHRTRRPLIMGIVNVTPDSFSDGGSYDDPARAVVHAHDLIRSGAAIIDIGGESTRPGNEPVPEAEECARVLPVITRLAGDVGTPISIDSFKSGTARAAIDAGAVMVNDIWGLQCDPAMADVIAEAGALAVLMHNRVDIDPGLDMLGELNRFFDETLRRAEKAGIPREDIVLDPGVGFGKTDAQNLASIAAIETLRSAYDLPVLLGVSRKSFIGRLLSRGLDDRLGGTLGANMAGVLGGAAIFRVHDVAIHADMLRMMTLIGSGEADE